jgi:predicted GNAT family acetyltransferase
MYSDDTHETEKLDETLDETFPASDAPANTVETGIRIATNGEDVVVRDNSEANRFEAVKDGHVSVLEYRRRPGEIVLIHTEVPEALRGHGIGNVLARRALAAAREEGLRIVVICPFVRAFLRRHPEMRTPAVREAESEP